MPRKQTLLERTLALLQKDSRKLPQIAEATGLNYFWLRSLKSGACKNPRILQVQKLHDSLLKN